MADKAPSYVPIDLKIRKPKVSNNPGRPPETDPLSTIRAMPDLAPRVVQSTADTAIGILVAPQEDVIELGIGDTVVYKDGTQKTILAIDGESITVEVMQVFSDDDDAVFYSELGGHGVALSCEKLMLDLEKSDVIFLKMADDTYLKCTVVDTALSGVTMSYTQVLPGGFGSDIADIDRVEKLPLAK